MLIFNVPMIFLYFQITRKSLMNMVFDFGQVLKLLEQESIKWVEGETAGTILIRLDNIDRKRLSFFKA